MITVRKQTLRKFIYTGERAIRNDINDSIQRILKSCKFHPYKIRLVQELNEHDQIDEVFAFLMNVHFS